MMTKDQENALFGPEDHEAPIVGKHTPELIRIVTETIRGYKSHWQETFDRVERDELVEQIAKHIEHKMGDFFYGSITEYPGIKSITKGYAVKAKITKGRE